MALTGLEGQRRRHRKTQPLGAVHSSLSIDMNLDTRRQRPLGVVTNRETERDDLVFTTDLVNPE